MSEKFTYLKEFLPPRPQYKGTNRNWFFPIDEQEIIEAEKKFKISFPEQLKEFYQEIGYGSLYAPYNAPEGYKTYISNKILPPLVAAHFYQEIIEHHTVAEKEEALEYDDHWFAQSTLDIVEPGDLPFFEIGDSTTFMVMKPHSENPNAVWYMGREKVEDSFEQFIWNLYYKDPAYWEEKLS